MTKLSAWLFAGLFALTWGEPVEARPNRVDQIPNGAVNGCANCHISAAGGGARNAFGRMVEANFLTRAGFAGDVKWGPELARLDADADGFGNGEELGDPNGAWLPGNPQPGARDRVRLPGDAQSVPPPLAPADFEGWKASARAADFNGDGLIERIDFRIFVWLNSKDAADLNKDGIADVLDFGIFFELSDGELFPPRGEEEPPPPQDDPGGPPLEEVRGTVEKIDALEGIIRLQSRRVPLSADAEISDASTNAKIALSDLQVGDHLVVRALWTRDGQPIARQIVRNGEPPHGTPTLWVQYAGSTTTANGQRALLAAGKEVLVAFDAPVFRGARRQAIDLEEVVPGDQVALKVRYDQFGAAAVEVHADPPPPAPRPGGGPEPFWEMVQRVFEVDPAFRLLRFAEGPILVDEDTEYLDEFGFAIGPEDLFFEDPLVIQVDNQTRTALVVEIQDPARHYDLHPDPRIHLFFASFDRIEEDKLHTFESFWRNVAVDVPVVDEETGAEVSGDLAALDLEGRFVRVRIRHPQPGEEVSGDIIVSVGLNPSDRPLEPGEKPTPREIFGEWDDLGVLAHVDVEQELVVRAGVAIRLGPESEIVDEDGFLLDPEDLRPGDPIAVDALATRDPGTVLARVIRVNPVFPPEGYERPIFEATVLGVQDERIITEGGRFYVADDAHLRDGQTGEDLELGDFQTGDLVNIRVLNTDVGGFIAGMERNPRIDRGGDRFWEGEWEIFSVEREHGEVLFSGPPIGFVSRTQVRDREGRAIALRDIPVGTPIVIAQSPSATGGPPVARSVEIHNFEKRYEGPNLFFSNFAGVEGDLIRTVDHPRYLAVDAELVRGDGGTARIDDLRRGVRVRAFINHPLAGLNSPFGDVITRMVINPQLGGGGGQPARPVETGEIEGEIFAVDAGARSLELQGPFLGLDRRTEIVGRERQRLQASDLREGDLVAVNFFQAPDILRATKITLLDPLRVPQPRPDLIVGPVIRVDSGAILLGGPAFTVSEQAEIRLGDGSRGALADLQEGDRVRVSAREQEGRAVAVGIKVSGAFTGPIFGGGGLQITSTFPAPGETSVASGTAVEVTFNEAVRSLLADPDFDIGFFPFVDFDLDLSRDGRTMLLSDISFEEDTVYQLFVISERFGLFTMNFTTGEEMPSGSIVGRLNLPEEVPFERFALEESGVFLLDAEGDLEEIDDEDFARGTPFEASGQYRFENVADGEYFVFAFVVVEFGFGERIELEAFFDADGDGEPDPVPVAGGRVEGVDLSIVPPAPMAVEEVFPEYGQVSVGTRTTVEITFSEPVGVDRRGVPAVEGFLFPQPRSGRVKAADMRLSADHFTVSFDVQLAQNTTYSLLVAKAESEDGLKLEVPEVVVFTTGAELPEGVIEGTLGLPQRLPAERVIRRPALVALVPFRDFDPFNPLVEDFAVAATLSDDGFYSFDHVPAGRYAVVAGVDVALPSSFRPPSSTTPGDFDAFVQEGRFGREAPRDFVDVPFFGFSRTAGGQVRDDVRPGSEGVDIVLRPEDVRRVALRVNRFEPGREVLDRAPEIFDLTIEFSEPLVVRRNFVELDASIRPQPLSGRIMEDMDIEDGGRRIVFRDIELEPGASYRFSIGFARGISGQELAEPFNLSIRTAGAEELVLGDVRGRVRVQGDQISAASVFLYEPGDPDLQVLAGALVEADGTYEIEEVVAGEYAAYAEIQTVGGVDLLVLYDADSDGEADLVQVGEAGSSDIDFAVEIQAEVPEGETVQLTLDAELDLEDGAAVAAFEADFAAQVAALLGIDPERVVVIDLAEGSLKITFVIAEAEETGEASASEAAKSLAAQVVTDSQALGALGAVLAVETEQDQIEVPQLRGPNAGAVLALDLNASAGNQGQVKKEVKSGETVDLAVYGSKLQNMTGVSVSVSFDTAQVAFEKALEAGSDEAHALRSKPGAIALFLPARLRANVAEYGGAILSPTSSTAAGGEGLLGVLRFTTLEGYSGATLKLDQVIFNSLGGIQDTIMTQPTVLVTPPIDLLSQPKGFFSFDFDAQAGDGGVFHLGEVSASEELAVEVYVNGAEKLTNYSVKVLYDPDQLNYVTFAEGDFLGSKGGTALGLPPLLEGKTIEFGSAILGPTEAVSASGSGHVGTLTFSTTENFSETDLVIVEYSTKKFGGQQVDVEASIFARISTQAIGADVPSKPTADFDRNGTVDFTDFFLFADAFGQPDPDPRFDLDGNGAVDFADFFLFADAFGRSASKGAMAAWPAGDGFLALEARSTEDVLEIDLRSVSTPLRGYAVLLEYDAGQFRLERIDDGASALRQEGRPALLLQQQQPGRVLLSGSRTGGAGSVEGLLARLRFAPSRAEAEGVFRLSEGVVRGASGDLEGVARLGAVSARWAPQVFALGTNYPNPFNPSTTIRYQVPHASSVRVVVYDALGQRVRELVSGVVEAGYHRAVWDGRDGAGRQVSSGVYFARLEAGDFAQVRKLLLLK